MMLFFPPKKPRVENGMPPKGMFQRNKHQPWICWNLSNTSDQKSSPFKKTGVSTFAGEIFMSQGADQPEGHR